MNRIVLGIEYDGSNFSGWQWQPQRRTVQHTLEQGLSKIANQAITVHCAGRTDAGVHALEQIVHFDSVTPREMRAWVFGGNSHLPDDIRITWAKPAIGDFHARFSAIARVYRYIILNRPVQSALQGRQVTWYPRLLDAERMHLAAQSLLGEHDFSSFRAANCQSKSPCREIHFIDVYRNDDQIIMDIAANAFLHHMVRNIAGVLIAIGSHKRPITWTNELLAVKDRKLAGLTAPPQGLRLAAVCYPEHYGIDRHPLFAKLPVNASRYDSSEN